MAGRIQGITIRIDGDATPLTTALKSVDAALKKTNTNLRDLNKALKLDPGNTELLKDRQQELARAIQQTEERLDKEKAAYQELQAADKTPENVEKMRQLKTQIDLDTAALSQLKTEAAEAASVLGTKMQVAGQKLQEVGGKIKDVGSKISGLGRTMTTTVTMPIVAGFTAAIKTTADFDAQMSKVQAISGATADDLSKLSAKAREMGETTKFSATESGEAMEYMAMAGWKTADMVDGLEGIMYLAAAAGEELGTTSDIVTDGLTAFHMAASESSHFADVLAAASANANTNVSMMGETFKYVAPVAGAVGYSIEDIALASGLMANAGIKASMAGTSLRNVIQRMAKPTKESAAAMDRLGLSMSDEATGRMYTFREIMDQLRVSFKDINMSAEDYDQQLEVLQNALEAGNITQKQYNSELEELNKQAFGAEGAEKARAAAMLGGARAMSGLMAIAEASEEDYNKLAAAIDGSSQSMAMLADGSVMPLNEALASGQEIIAEYSGAAEAMAMQMQNNLTGDVTILKSALQELAISMGELLMPLLRDLVAEIQGVVDSLNALDDGQKKTIMQVAAVVAVVGPALMVIGGVISAIGTIVGAVGSVLAWLGSLVTFVTGTLIPVITTLAATISVPLAPILAIIAGVAALIAIFVHLFNTNEEFRAKVIEVWEAVKAAFASGFEQISAWVASLGEILAPIGTAFQETFGAISEFISAWVAAVGEYISGFINKHRTEIETVLGVVRLLWDNALMSIKTIVETILNAVTTFITGSLSVIQNLFRAFTSLLKGDWQSAWNYLLSAARSMLNMLLGVFNDLWNGIKSIFNGLISNFKEWGHDMINNLVQGIKDKIGDVTGAIAGVGENIRSLIHFSVPDYGPLADFDEWAPDMMKLFAQGITDNASLITDAVSKSFNIRPAVNQTVIQGQNQGAPASAGPIAVNVTLEGDANRLYRVVRAEAVRNQQITGMSFA